MKKNIVKIILIFTVLVLVGYLFYMFATKVGNNEFKSFEIKKSSNNEALLDDYSAVIENDSIKIFVPYLVNYNLKANYKVSSGAKVYCDGEEIVNGKSIVDYTKPRQFQVVAENGEEKTYTVCIYNSGLPIVFVATKNGQDIMKGNWLDETHFTVYNEDGSVDYDSEPDLVQIRGRGNSTWGASSEKRPYGIKLNKKGSILGMPNHKRWALMANFFDATLFRNTFTNYISRKYTNQDWVPNGYNVELVVNGSHKGNYYLCESVKINKHRVNGKYLLEADIKAGLHQSSIIGSKSNNAFYIKDSKEKEVTYSDSIEVKNIIDKFETALYGGEYDSLLQLIDLESFVDWYIIKEWSRDCDGNMCTSCYFTIMEDGKIKMGPLWDFDLSWGSFPVSKMGEDFNAYEGYYVTTNPLFQSEGVVTTSWFGEFIKMPAFRTLLKKKVLNINSNMDDIFTYIDENTEKMILSASANEFGNPGTFGFTGGWGGGISGRLGRIFFNRWGCKEFPGKDPEVYRKSMSDLKNYVKTRMDWFVKEVNKF